MIQLAALALLAEDGRKSPVEATLKNLAIGVFRFHDSLYSIDKSLHLRIVAHGVAVLTIGMKRGVALVLTIEDDEIDRREVEGAQQWL